ncbi:acetoacetate metabolism regulatory protein AtoC [Desulfosarcina alkanivorans]|uniref:Acetoacetate metabolism regulatory protein AtoC n=1 Tax=Desulfosarcina alkanivorans TaxID=571177 RepID=A0A5K7YUK4_9BACT|nr:sigma-54 dependent transcriptional regulator [Desulfosarcina alkanivorans]BBO71980.1 acetoacetate metabolism regulatory protein AtoC [Desulfosarcina alkanivorans]
MPDTRILFVDDDRDILAMVEQYLTIKGYDVTTVDNGIEAVGIVKEKEIDIVFTDYKMPEFNGLELLVAIKKYRPQTEVIIVTGYGSMESAIQAMKFGSYDYLQKPFKLDHLKLIIDRIVEEKKIKNKAQLIRKIARERHHYGKLIGICPKMREIYEVIDTISIESPMVLIQGESGTGKELTARTIHDHSDRKEMPFILANCNSLTKATQTEDEITGHLSDMLTSVGGGTLYLDEISSLSSTVRKRMTALLADTDVDAGHRPRLIAGTSRDLEEIIASGSVKKDLLDLFNAVFIKLPPLRERKEDIPLLINHFLYVDSPAAKTRIYGMTPAAMNILLRYHWPGNLIQLQNVIERAFAMGVENAIGPEDLPAEIRTFGTISQMA